MCSELHLSIILTHFELCARLIPINFGIVRLRCVHVYTLHLVPSNICRSSKTVGVANCSYNRVNLIRGRALQQAVGCRPVTAYTRSRSQASPRWIIYLLTAIGLSPGGSSAVQIYTQTIHRTIQNKQYIEQHNNWKSAGRAPSWLVIPWHLPYNRGKSTEKPQSG